MLRPNNEKENKINKKKRNRKLPKLKKKRKTKKEKKIFLGVQGEDIEKCRHLQNKQ